MGLTLFEEVAPLWAQLQLTPASSTDTVDTLTPQGATMRVDAVQLSSSSTSAHIVRLWVTRYDGNGLIGSVSVPAGAGFAAAPVVDAIAALAPIAIGAIILPPGTSLGISLEVALETGEAIGVNILGGYV